MFSDTGAPCIITSDRQLETYVSALLELDRRGYLTISEQNFAELLSVLIESYVEKTHPDHRAKGAPAFNRIC